MDFQLNMNVNGNDLKVIGGGGGGVGVGDFGNDVEKAARRRERNKELARKSRQKKKVELDVLKDQVTSLSGENSTLHFQVRQLQNVLLRIHREFDSDGNKDFHDKFVIPLLSLGESVSSSTSSPSVSSSSPSTTSPSTNSTFDHISYPNHVDNMDDETAAQVLNEFFVISSSPKMRATTPP